MNEADLLAAHARRDVTALIALYTKAGEARLAAGDAEAGYFYLTHAMVFALEAGDPRADDLHARLATAGRD